MQAAKKASEYQDRESGKRSDAAKARLAAAKTRNASTAKSKLAETEKREKEAEAAGKGATRWRNKESGYLKEETALMKKLTNAEASESKAAEHRRSVNNNKPINGQGLNIGR